MKKKIKEIIRSFYHYYKAKRLFRGLSQEQQFLEEGDYYVSINSRTYLIKKGTPKAFLAMIGANDEKFKRWNFLHKFSCNSKNLKAQVVMSTNSQFRFFDYKNNITFRRFSSNEEKLKYDECRERFHPFFKLTCVDNVNEYCLEIIIKNKPRGEWDVTETKEYYIRLLDKYVEYLRSINNKPVFVKDTLLIVCSNLPEYMQLFSLLTKEVEPYIKTRMVFSHGDLHFGNVLFDGKDFYIIDFEMAKEDVFFYDLFNVMYVEAVDMSNYYFIDSYMAADSVLMNSFSFGML